MLKYDRPYARRNGIIYEDGVKILQITSKLIDVEHLSEGGIKYMNAYIAMYPEKVTIFNKEMPKIKKIFYDSETTGTDYRKHSIHQLSGYVEIDGVVVNRFDFKVRPHHKAKIEPEALEVSNVTEEEILAYPPMSEVYQKLLVLLSTYCDRYDRTDKIWLIGFNNRNFDDLFLRKFFELNKDPYFNAWFWPDSQDTMVLASRYLEDRRHKMDSFQLHRVAKELGLIVDDEKLHDGLYDVDLTYQIYRIVTGIDIEI
jgi:DNA polymerase III subunit epsilon